MDLDGELKAIRDALFRDGFVLIPNVFDDDSLAGIEEVLGSLVERFRAGESSAMYWHCMVGNQKVLYRIHGLEKDIDSRLADLFETPEYKKVLAVPFSSPSRMTACAVVFKEARVGLEVPWHRDPVNVPASTVFNVSVFVSADNSSSGCFEAVKGSHLVKHSPDIPIEQLGRRVPLKARRGDVLIHDTQVVHGSGPNSASTVRASLVTEWCSTRLHEARVRGKLNKPYGKLVSVTGWYQ